MKVTQRVRKILDNYESDNPGTKANLARMLCTGRLGGTGKTGYPAGRPGLRTRSGAQLRAQSRRLRSGVPCAAGDRCRAERLCVGARHDRVRRRPVRRPDPVDPEGQQLQHAAARQGSAGPGDHRLGRRRGASRLRRDRLYHLSGLRRVVRHVRGVARADRRSQGEGPRRRRLVVSARRQPLEGRRDGDRRRWLRGAHGGAARRALHQGEAADAFLEQGEAKKVYEKEGRSTSRPRRRASATSCSAASTASASSSSPAAR